MPAYSFVRRTLPGLFALLFIIPLTAEAQLTPPDAKQVPYEHTYHDQAFPDPYAWLRDRDDPEVIAYLEAENVYTDSVTSHTNDVQEKLFKEMVGRIKETDLSVPVKMDDYFYYTRTEEGLQYDIHCRKKGNLDAEEEIILDENILAEGHDYFSIGDFEVSPDHRLLAYNVDTSGDERYTLFVKDLGSDELLSDIIENTASIEWANDNRTLFYTTQDETKRPYRLYRHALGSDSANDPLIHEEPNLGFFMYISKTKDHAYLLLSMGGKITDEVHFLDANDPTADFQVIQPRSTGLEYRVDHHQDTFYIVTNDQAQNFKLVKTPVASPGREHWQDVLPHRPQVKLDYIEAFEKYLVVFERAEALRKIRVMSYDGETDYYVQFDEPIYNAWGNWNPDYYSPTFRFTYTSFITPKSVYDFNMATRERELMKEYEVLGDYDRTLYQSERRYATAADGTQIPISLVYRKGMEINGKNPCYLTGYGSYGSSSDPYFSYSRVSLLQRGFIYAVAHVRGGGEMGRQWYEDGKFLNKKNTFTDFIACAEFLIAEKYTSTEKLVINGGSAGGMLMGAVVNMRPDLFHIVVADVPFVDVINTMMDPSIPLTVLEYDEWGNPNEKKYFDYMLSYSPYDNITAQDYPTMLVTAGLNDPRVGYWEAAKFVAKLRDLKTDDNLLLLKTNMGAGHMGASGRYDSLREVAFEYAFIFDQLGIEY